MTVVWPYDVHPVYNPDFDDDWGAIVHRGVGAVRQVREELSSPVYRARLVYDVGPSDLDLLDQAIASCRGPAVAFAYFDDVTWRRHRAVAVGTGDGTTRSFALPFGELNETELVTVLKVAGTAKTRGTDYDIGVANRVAYSEDLSNATFWAIYSGSTVVRTAGQTDPLGGSTAWRVETSGGTNVVKLVQAIGTPTSGFTCLTDLYVKNAGAKALTITDGLGGTQTLTGGSAAFVRVTLSSVAAGAGHSLAFSAPAAGDALDFTVWHPWCAWSDANFGAPTTAWGYMPTVAAIPADSVRRLKVAFYTAAIPTAGQAITVDAAGRRYHLCALAGSVVKTGVPKYRRFRREVEIHEVTA